MNICKIRKYLKSELCEEKEIEIDFENYKNADENFLKELKTFYEFFLTKNLDRSDFCFSILLDKNTAAERFELNDEDPTKMFIETQIRHLGIDLHIYPRCYAHSMNGHVSFFENKEILICFD